MLLSWGWGVVPCLCRAGGDVGGSAWRQGTSSPLWDFEPVGMFEGPVGCAQLRELAAVELSAHRCVSPSSSPRRPLASKAPYSSVRRCGRGGAVREAMERSVALEVHKPYVMVAAMTGAQEEFLPPRKLR